MATEYKSVHLPVGYEVAVQTDPNTPDVYTDLGVTNQAGTLAISYDAIKVTGSRAETVKNFFKNMSLEATFSLFQLELSNINKLMSGASAYASVAGTPVVGATQTLVASTWARETFYAFEHQQGAGTVPTAISLANPGALVLNTDYVIVQSGGKWGFIILATKGTLANNLVVTYTYTPSASRTLSMGSSSVDVTARSMRIRKLLDTGKYWTIYIYAAVNTSGLSFSLPRYDEDEPTSLEVTMTAQLDTTRTDLDQLFKIEDQYGIEDI